MDGLIIKKKWLDLFFTGKKTWEVRSTNAESHIGQRIALIESGSGEIKGDAFLDRTFLMNSEQFNFCKQFHLLNKRFYKNNWAWCLVNIQPYPKGIKYNHPKGAVIWVKNVL